LVKRTGHVYKDDKGIEHTHNAGDQEVVIVKYVHVKGSIFFGSARHFINMFSVANDPPTIVIDFKDALIIDHSAVAAIGGITHRFAKVGKRVLLVNLPHKSHGRLHRTGDHAILKKQIVVHKDELIAVEQGDKISSATDVDVLGDDTEEKKTESIHEAYHGDDGAVDTYHTPKDLQDLQMFKAGVESVDEEIDHLEDVHGKFEVHEIGNKKNS